MSVPRRIHAGASALGLWWHREWREAMPDSFEAPEPDRSARLLLRAEEEDVVLTLVAKDGETVFVDRVPWWTYGRDDLDRYRRKAASLARGPELVVSLSPAHVVAQSLLIPRKARSRASEIVWDHVARKTPLNRADVLTGYNLSPAGKDKLELRYLVIPRKALSDLLERFEIPFAQLDGLEGPSLGDLPPVKIPLKPRQARSGLSMGNAAVSLLAIAALAALVGFGTLAWRQQAQVQEIEEQAAATAEPLRQAAARLKAFVSLARDVDRLNELRTGSSVVRAWEELARILPDTTHLTEVDIEGARLQISGFSAAASELIGLFENSPIFFGAGFSGPVVFDQGMGKERFSLTASLRRPRLPAEERS